jgi:hypothetical protein
LPGEVPLHGEDPGECPVALERDHDELGLRGIERVNLARSSQGGFRTFDEEISVQRGMKTQIKSRLVVPTDGLAATAPP